MKNLSPTCTARVSVHTTKAGKQNLLVSVVTPDAVAFRTYERIHDDERETAIANALRSLGLPSAWVWGFLDRPQGSQCDTPDEATNLRKR